MAQPPPQRNLVQILARDVSDDAVDAMSSNAGASSPSAALAASEGMTLEV